MPDEPSIFVQATKLVREVTRDHGSMHETPTTTPILLAAIVIQNSQNNALLQNLVNMMAVATSMGVKPPATPPATPAKGK